MTMSISDLTGQTWVNAFNEVAELMIGKPAAEMVDLKESVRHVIGETPIRSERGLDANLFSFAIL